MLVVADRVQIESLIIYMIRNGLDGDGHGKHQFNLTTNETLSITIIQCIWSMQTIFLKLDQEGGIQKIVLQSFMLFVADGHIH